MLSTLVGWLAPVSCLGCGREGSRLCRECAALATPHPATCWGCNRLSPERQTCDRCRRSSSLAGVVVGARYDGVVKELILALKFGRDTASAQAAAALLTPLFESANFDLVTSVPSAPSRRRQRGYNQSALIAKSLAAALGLPYRPLLGRWHQAEQIGAGRRERFLQVEGAFYAKGRPPRRVLVVDDVLTTGATLDACARVLRQAGCTEVWGAAVAKH